MSGAREQILGGIRRSLRRGMLDDEARAQLRAKLDAPARNLIPRRTHGLDQPALADLFVAMAEAAQASVQRVGSSGVVPAALADFLAARNLPARLVMTNDPLFGEIPWAQAGLIDIRWGRAEADDLVGITACLAAVAETGTLMLVSGPESPTRNNFLPDTHIVVLGATQIVASYEDGFDLVRRRGAGMPRTVNFITGPSRTGDIEQQIHLGAHGPRNLHIILIEDR